MRSRLALLLAIALVGCESPDPESSPRDGGTQRTDAAPEPLSCTGAERITVPDADDPSCQPRSGDYVPGSPDDGWPVCISDDNAYHRFSASISSLTRVAAFDAIAEKLGFGSDKIPTEGEFIEARALFSADQGLGSRVERREDEHYPAAPKACNELSDGELALHPDRCAGPVKILPIVNAAFTAGGRGEEPRANAARIEAALLWFLYLSPYKEARTCAAKVDDCDSSYAYYTGGDTREAEGKGFSRYVRARSKKTHDAIWNGLLAVRCWRDLDNPTSTAADLALRDRAVDQLDRAMHKGLAVIVRQRVALRMCNSSWEGTRVLGAVLDREATTRDPANAAVLRAELEKADPAQVDGQALTAALDALFPCAY